MRGFTQTLLNALLGWIRTLVEGIWDILFSNEAHQWLKWVADNWFVLVIFLCLCGVVLDYLIWLLRWRPYYVWASSIRRMKRLFGGGKVRENQKIKTKAHPEPLPEPAQVQEYVSEGAAYDNDAYEGDTAWEEQIWEQPTTNQPEAAWSATPAVTADTILARPRKTDYQEQYVRRFARPEPDTLAEPVYQEEPEMDWADTAQEYTKETESAQEVESWTPEPSQGSFDQPLHPGIDYQALSRQYGWYKEVTNQDTQTMQEQDRTEEQRKEPVGPAWSFSGLESFSPYRAPAPPAEREQRNERARKTRVENTPMSRVKSSLNRIAQRAGKVLTVDDEDANKIIDGLPPPIDKRRAFRAPVYPNRPGANTKRSPDFREDD